ncbi:hypothetical protein OJF2_24790 [Aquisphaera giovannonii]|uniref:Uncharacterized protein n=1 Tax=Aquisphaera giovannonii TaxID=406548 RepID=A0A5B9W0X1_9BACT|nr:hypothetical protein OJF2_24790 [Aquisphaera giovannonii]
MLRHDLGPSFVEGDVGRRDFPAIARRSVDGGRRGGDAPFGENPRTTTSFLVDPEDFVIPRNGVGISAASRGRLRDPTGSAVAFARRMLPSDGHANGSFGITGWLCSL